MLRNYIAQHYPGDTARGHVRMELFDAQTNNSNLFWQILGPTQTGAAPRVSAPSHAAAGFSMACESCHTQPAPAGASIASLGSHCAACHRDDDAHDGSFGSRCEQCHVGGSWKALRARGAPAPATPGWFK